MKTQRSQGTFLAAMVLVVSLGALLWQLSNIREIDGINRQLNAFQANYAELRVTVLNLYFGRQNNYDTLNQVQREMNQQLVELMVALEQRGGETEHRLANELASSFQDTSTKVENFKGLDAISRNAKRFLSYRVDLINETWEAPPVLVSNLNESLLRYLGDKSSTNSEQVSTAIFAAKAQASEHSLAELNLLERQFNYVLEADTQADLTLTEIDNNLSSGSVSALASHLEQAKSANYQLLVVPFALGILSLLVILSQVVKLTRSLQANNESLADLNHSLEARISDATAVIRQQMEVLEIDRKRANEANEAKSSFLANMTHELRTPLNGISGMAQVLQNSDLSDDQSKYVGTILNTSSTLGTIINDILDFSKVEAGKIEIENVEFELLELVESTIDELTHAANRNQCQLVVELDPELPRSLTSDPTRIAQVLRNLLSNAIKFCSHGVVTVSVKQVTEDNGDRRVRVVVQDTGIGIAADKIDTIFEAFSQEDESTTRRFGGTGLGLAVSKRLIELMGGEISVSSKVGFGSKFRFFIPLQYGASEETIRAKRGPLTHIKPVIYDTNEVRGRALLDHLRSWHLVCTSFSKESAFVEYLQKLSVGETDYTCVIAETEHLPTETLEQLSLLNKHLPVVELTPLFHQDIPADELRFSGYISSPIKPSALMDSLASIHGGTLRTEREESPQVSFDFSGRSVLLVDDNDVNRMVAELLLDEVNVSLDMAEDGVEALAMVQEKDYEVVFMDCQMPNMDGYEATRRIRALAGEKSKTPVIAMTANAMKGDKEKCFQAGMCDYISKPVDAQELYKLLNKWLNEAPSQNQASSL
ncbi:ATP-binding protein [Umboniibacter marinipuniceus]|uniref:histidine kinase n=1 Tax=Umboniibacter marinipuniceus TaxID=569599 RepID=A0A3M0AG53_9GAMM|nr:ATP-binding protein [Umboniibacter marinipuniceus]RMA82599.1 signal transduction histidine kinase [Umboniibacter marinipuniceus]